MKPQLAIRSLFLLLALCVLTACGGPLSSAVNPYFALGDSITYGLTLPSPSTQAYPFLVGTSLARALTNLGNGGDQGCDLFPRQIYPKQVGFAPHSNVVYSIMIGTNDVDMEGPGAYEAIFNNCQSAAITWLGTQPSDRLLPASPALTLNGACTVTAATAGFAGTITCGTGVSGSIRASAFATTGSPIYIWYGIGDDYAANASFTVTIDDAPSQTVPVHATPALATQNGIRNSIGMLRIPTAAGLHRVAIATATGGISIQAIGTNNSIKPIPIAIGDLPNQLFNSPMATLAAQRSYSADIQANIASAAADGIDARFVPDRFYMLGQPSEMNDKLHPNALGQAHLATAFETVLH